MSRSLFAKLSVADGQGGRVSKEDGFNSGKNWIRMLTSFLVGGEGGIRVISDWRIHLLGIVGDLEKE